MCPGSHFQETINNSFQNRPTDLAEGSLDAQLHSQFNCVKIFKFGGFLGGLGPNLNIVEFEAVTHKSNFFSIGYIEYYQILSDSQFNLF